MVHVSAGSTVGIITCIFQEGLYKIYRLPRLWHWNWHWHGTGLLVPNGDSSGLTNKIFATDVNAGETVLLEPSYPLVLDTTGDSLQVGTGNITGVAATHINFLITGDKEDDTYSINHHLQKVRKLIGLLTLRSWIKRCYKL